MVHTKSISSGYGKKHKWVVTPKQGAHEKKDSIPLLLLVRDRLGLADSAREAKKIIREGLILVDGVPRKESNYSVGLMDVLSIPKAKKHYRLMPSKKGLVVSEIGDGEAKTKLKKIVGKTTLHDGLIQLKLHDGATLVPEKGEYNIGDTLVWDLDSKKASKVLEFKEGSTALIVRGVHSGEIDKIAEKLPGQAKKPSLTRIGQVQTLSEYVFVVGTDKPVISVD